MISDMSTQQPSLGSNQSGEVDLSSMPISFVSKQVPLNGGEFSQAMIQDSVPASLGSYSLNFSNKQPMENLHSPKDRISESIFLGLKHPQRTSKLQARTEPLPIIQNQAPVNTGASFPSTSNKQNAPMGSLQKLQTTMPMIAGSQQLPSMINKRPAQELQGKVQAEFESVRSKLRESLASALSTGSKEHNKPRFLEKGSICDKKCFSKLAEASSLQNEIHPFSEDDSLSEILPHYLPPDIQAKKSEGNQGLSESSSSGNFGDQNEAHSIGKMQVGHEKHDIVMDDAPFSSHSIIKDEFLQGHGLCWVSDLVSVNADSTPSASMKRPKLMDLEENRGTRDTALQACEKLSVLIEAELFKLFGGVNKKYKEKGRSLLFNLKDPSNPELRERVLSGELSPERLCSMTAEELASKELSQWRQAKAEVFAQMVVLPESNIDIRRLVKKTHKGEFQVEVEHDDGAHVEVGLGSDAFSKLVNPSDSDQSQPKSNDKRLIFSRTHDLMLGDKSDSDGRNASSSVHHRLPEKTDYIQDFMVEELKDTELLPPVVSLDEFMQALDSEPPFENLEAGSLQENPVYIDRNLDRSESQSSHVYDSSGHKIDSTPDISAAKLDFKLASAQIYSKHAKKISSPNSGQVDYSSQKSVDMVKKDGAYGKHVAIISESPSKCNLMWEGFLQLNVSALSNVVVSFLSGEKTSMQEWPSLLEVKGRVRLDAFEKFMQELPLSRSRTIMTVEFRWKEDSMESGRIHFSEAIHSYITDERLGFAEPLPGFELYLCPSHPKIISILTTHLSKELHDSINGVANGLIGIVVWRRPHSTVSPKVSSHHHKHGGSKKHSGSRKRHEGPKHSSHRNPILRPGDGPGDDDEVPPGFGPPLKKDDDDLPEFDFSGARGAADRHVLPSNHMRELIQKYGQGESKVKELGIPVEPWNDDDDIPEWNPNQNPKLMPPQSMPLMPTPPLPPPRSMPLLSSPPLPQQGHVYQQPFAVNPNLMPPQFVQTQLAPPIRPQVGGLQANSSAMWWPGAARGVPEGGFRLPGPGVGPRMVQGFGGGRSGLGFWRPDNNHNNHASKGL